MILAISDFILTRTDIYLINKERDGIDKSAVIIAIDVILNENIIVQQCYCTPSTVKAGGNSTRPKY